ncbi:MAG: hypothetical protein ACJ768_06380 [Gaiellaceae bacterium]
MLTALTPPVKAAPEYRTTWLANVTIHTAGGLLTSAMVGLALAAAGRLSGETLDRPVIASACLLLAMVVAARELGVVRLPLLQARRASKGAWGRRFGQPRASLLWGLDIGLFFTTWLTYAGAWWLAAVAALGVGVGWSAGLFVAYWLGRTIPVWLGPWLVPNATVSAWIETALAPLRRSFRAIHSVTVLLGGVVILLAALPSL